MYDKIWESNNKTLLIQHAVEVANETLYHQLQVEGVIDYE
jgi:hypothetical protein